MNGEIEMVKQIPEEVQASLEPHRKAKIGAQELLAQALALKQQSAENVLKGERDADQARLLLDDHEQAMKSKKALRAQARANRIASGRSMEPQTMDFDVEGRRLREDAEEADAAYVNLKEIDALRSIELQKAEAAVTAAETGIYQAYLEGIAAQMIEHNSVMRGLHAELSSMVPSEINRPRTMPRPSPLAEKALALVVIDELHVPVSQLQGGTTHTNAWAERRKALTG
jgi:hypothetical protein